MRSGVRLLALFCLAAGTTLGAESVTILSVGDAPDPFSPPVKSQSNITGQFRFSGTGPDVDNPAQTGILLFQPGITFPKAFPKGGEW